MTSFAGTGENHLSPSWAPGTPWPGRAVRTTLPTTRSSAQGRG